jgi:Histidine biosynthesis protein
MAGRRPLPHTLASARSQTPELIPILMIASGRVMTPGPDGPVAVLGPNDKPVDLFETADALIAEYRRLYVVDLDGIERSAPQLDYLQELARGGELWVDAGPRKGDDVADVLVAGATRAILSTARIRSALEVKRAYRLSPDLLLEIEIRSKLVHARANSWAGTMPAAVAKEIREVGVTDLVISPREEPVDWALVRDLSLGGPVWVDGTFEQTEGEALRSSGARGGFFHPAVPGKLLG